MASVSGPLAHPGTSFHLRGRVELLPAAERSSLPCGSGIETLPYKALGDGGPARLFFSFFPFSSLLNKPVHTASGERVKPLCP